MVQVMVDDALTFKLGDLGTAKRLDGTVNMMTTFAGTPVYMAPEVVRRDPYNEKSDIWSLGHMLYELCTQELLFNPSTLQSLVHKVRAPFQILLSPLPVVAVTVEQDASARETNQLVSNWGAVGNLRAVRESPPFQCVHVLSNKHVGSMLVDERNPAPAPMGLCACGSQPALIPRVC